MFYTSMYCDAVCSDRQIRLAGGSNHREGRFEICFNNTWGTVCNNGWNLLDAKVVCRMLNFSYNSKFVNTCILTDTLQELHYGPVYSFE